MVQESDAHGHIERGAALKFPDEMIARLAHRCRHANVLRVGAKE
jgi:hypothetical protein